jgi:flagellar assembly protein FliH
MKIRRLLSKDEVAVERYVLRQLLTTAQETGEDTGNPGMSAAVEVASPNTYEDTPAPTLPDPAVEEATPDPGDGSPPAAADIIRDEAFQQGYEAGLAEGRGKGFQEGAQSAETQLTAALEEHFNSLLEALKTGADAIGAEAEGLRRRFEQWLPRAALLISEQVLRREVQVDASSLGRVVSEALEDLPASVAAKVHLHPTDYARLAEQSPDVWKTERLTFVEDAAVSQGGALIETETNVIDARLESRLLEAARALLFPQDAEE